MTSHKDVGRAEEEKLRRCEVCEGRGWLLCFNVDREVYEIQRCDTCGRYDSDQAAGDAGAPLIQAGLAVMEKLIRAETQKVRARKGRQP